MARARKLRSAWCVLLLLVLSVSFSPAFAGSGCDGYDSSMAACQTNRANDANIGNEPSSCHALFYGGENRIGYTDKYAPSDSNPAWSIPYGCPAGWQPPNELEQACTSAFPGADVPTDGRVLEGYAGCSGLQTTASGAQVQCAISFSPLSPPTFDNNRGTWSTYIHVVASGQSCSGDKPVTDGTGHTVTPSPVVPLQPVITVTAPPDICGDGSCYDQAADANCATGDAGTVCLPGAVARTNAGGCASGGSATLCGGSPNAPAPPAAQVPDPATEIQSSDKLQQVDPVTGAPIPVGVVVYSTGGSTTSGQKPGDSGPAPASSTGDNGDKTKASGGDDCNSPPVCEGSAATCMVAKQSWLSRCGSSLADKDANGQPDWTQVKDSDGDQYATTTTANSEVISDDSSALSQVNSTSWAGNACPGFAPVQIFGQPWVPVDQDLFCQWLGVVRWALLLAGAWLSSKILASGGKS